MATDKWRYCWLGLLLFFACERLVFYKHILVLEKNQWPVDKVLDFTFQINDVTQSYDIYLLVTYTQDYPYQNLYVTYYLEETIGRTIRQALKNYPLFDTKTGNPLGRKGFRKYVKNEFVIIDAHTFDNAGLYTLKIEQFMRKYVFPGLQAVGIKVVASKRHTQ
mmetsp:Transcript_26441/g.61543  ORF Transcript_26441/g.61543 Transcript_26441/m.61543 type:complete len:163 (+) Transcript_26441:990-1478(+)